MHLRTLATVIAIRQNACSIGPSRHRVFTQPRPNSDIGIAATQNHGSVDVLLPLQVQRLENQARVTSSLQQVRGRAHHTRYSLSKIAEIRELFQSSLNFEIVMGGAKQLL